MARHFLPEGIGYFPIHPVTRYGVRGAIFVFLIWASNSEISQGSDSKRTSSDPIYTDDQMNLFEQNVGVNV